MRMTSGLRALLCAALVLSGCGDDDSDDRDDGVQLGEPASESMLAPVSPSFDEEASDDAGAEGELESEIDNVLAGDQLLCRSCSTNTDCGGGANYCLRRYDGVRFCGRDCRASACPSGYSCMPLSSTVSQCVPPLGDCARVPQPSDGGVADAGAIDAGVRDAGVVDAGTLDAGAPPVTGEVPNTPHCASAATWDPAWTSFENEVLRLSNQYRQAGATCGTTRYNAVAPLVMQPALRCAARLHSKDMIDRAYFSHTTPDGVTFSQRITNAGYRWRTVGENIASGYRSPQAVVDGWIKSPGHCVNLMNGAFRDIGVGFYGGAGSFSWTQDFGAIW